MSCRTVSMTSRRAVGRLLAAAIPLAALLAGCASVPARPPEPLSAEEHNDLGVAYYARGRPDLAVPAFRRALALRPGWTRALVNLGDAQLAADDVDGAIASYEAARATSPEDPAIANNLAWALLQHERRWQEAEPLIRAALRRGPEPRGYYLDTLGVLLLRKDEPERALAAFRAALADPALRDPGARALVLRHAGEALARLGDPGGAERCDRAARALASGASPAGPPVLWGQSPSVEVGRSENVC